MNIKFKALLAFGAGLWVSLLLTDWFFEKSKIEEVIEEPGENETLLDFIKKILGKQQRTVKSSKKAMIDIEESTSTSFRWTLLLWNLVAFISSISTVLVVKGFLDYAAFLYHKYKYVLRTPSTIRFAPTNTTYIDTKNPEASPKVTPIENEISTEIMSRDYSNTGSQDSAKSSYEKHMEQQCAKLREEMMAMQSVSMQENEMLCKKLEIVLKEKKELGKQLSVAQKEHRVTKRQLDDLMMEKDVLMKRLECANKEFKLNSRTKRSAMEQLEQSRIQIATLKKQIGGYAQEKERIEKKISHLDKEYQQLVKNEGAAKNVPVERDNKEVVERARDKKKEEKKETTDSDMKPISTINSEAEIKEHTYNSFEDMPEQDSKNSEQKQENIFEVDDIFSNSQLDMKMVHIKLLKLEESFEALRKRKQALKKQEMEEAEVKLKTLMEENVNNVPEKVTNELGNCQEIVHKKEVQERSQRTKQSQTPTVCSVKHSSKIPILDPPKPTKASIIRQKVEKAVGNLTDEQREKFLGPDLSDKEDGNSVDLNQINEVFGSDSQTDTDSLSDNQTADEEGEEFNSSDFSGASEDENDFNSPLFNIPTRLISNTPAFRKFLQALNMPQSNR